MTHALLMAAVGIAVGFVSAILGVDQRVFFALLGGFGIGALYGAWGVFDAALKLMADEDRRRA
jgi:hypothetical protein